MPRKTMMSERSALSYCTWAQIVVGAIMLLPGRSFAQFREAVSTLERQENVEERRPRARSQPWEFAAALTLAQGYDDNVFVEAFGPVSALITRISPELRLDYNSQEWMANFAYAYGLDLFSEDLFSSEPSAAVAGQRHIAHATVERRFSSRLQLALQASFVDTDTPRDLTLRTGFDAGRLRARMFEVGPVLNYSLMRNLTLGGRYVFGFEEQEDLRTWIHGATASLATRLSRRLTLTTDINGRHFEFGDVMSTTSTVLLVGLQYRLTNGLTARAGGGPRLTNGDFDRPDIFAGLLYATRRWSAQVALYQTLATIPGIPGPVLTQNVDARVRYVIRDKLEVAAGAGFFRTDNDTFQARVFLVETEVYYRFLDWMGLVASYRFSRQQLPLLDGVLGPTAVIYQNFAFLGLRVMTASSREP